MARWPDFIAPPQYPDVPTDWADTKLPDFRKIWAIGRGCGYAIGLHGSMKRDVDLIAAPWTDDAMPAHALVSELIKQLPCAQIGETEQKPQGRIAITLQQDGRFKHLDLSIMPLINLED